jgi:hypothetical protein
MAEWLIPVLFAFTTCAAAWLGWRGLGLPLRALGRALGRAFETLGATLVFFAANFGLSVSVALGVRRFTDGFLSLHQLSEWIVLALSLLQALVFQEWRQSKPGSAQLPAVDPSQRGSQRWLCRNPITSVAATRCPVAFQCRSSR